MSSLRVNDGSKCLKRKRDNSTTGSREAIYNAQTPETIPDEDQTESSSDLSFVQVDEYKHDKGATPQPKDAKDAKAKTPTKPGVFVSQFEKILEEFENRRRRNSDDDEPYDPSELKHKCRVKYHSREDWPWLLEVNAYAEDPDRSSAGECSAKLVDRDAIRSNFYMEMEGPTQDLSDLAFVLFDHWGNLKADFISHPIKKGTGVWGKELNKGSLLLFEDMKVKRRYRRQGIGRRMVQEVTQKALATDSTCHFAITQPVFMDQRNLNQRPSYEDSGKPENIAYMEAGQMATEDFWRSLGFRRIGSSPFFAFAMAGNHASLRLDKAEDYVRPSTRQSKVTGEGPLYPVDDCFMKADDQGTVRILRKRARAFPPNDERWFATNVNGGNVMHIVALSAKPRALAFLKRIPPGNKLSSTRDLEGYTPLELLQRKLENGRLSIDIGGVTVPVSEKFEGYSEDGVACLALLTNTPATNSIKMAELRFGCTCGECIGGFLSPRLVGSLLEASEKYRMLLFEDIIESGPHWCESYDFLLTNLHEPIRRNLRTNKSLRLAFVGLYYHIFETLAADKRVPTSSNVLPRTQYEWPPATKNFVKRGGTVAAVVLNFFDHAIDADRYLGGNDDDESDSEDDSPSRRGTGGPTSLKKCRNDRELIFARRQYLRTEGLAVEYPNEAKFRFG